MEYLDSRDGRSFLTLTGAAALALACGSSDGASDPEATTVQQPAHGPIQGVFARIVEGALGGPFAVCEARVRGLSLAAGAYNVILTVTWPNESFPGGIPMVLQGSVSAVNPVFANFPGFGAFTIELSESPPASGEYRLRATFKTPQPYYFTLNEQWLNCHASISVPGSTEPLNGFARASLRTPILAVEDADSVRIAGDHLRCKYHVDLAGTNFTGPFEIIASTETDLGTDVSVLSMALGDPPLGPIPTSNGGTLIAEWASAPFVSNLQVQFDRFPFPLYRSGTCDFSVNDLGTSLTVGKSKTIAFAGQPPCADGVDNDGDGFADYPYDPGCATSVDNDELDDCPFGPNCPECGNAADDDNFGDIDFPADPDCISTSGDSEGARTACSNGLDDNDADVLVDWPNDPGCVSILDNDESDDCPSGPTCPECANGFDDDGDGAVDYEFDQDCNSSADSEFP